MIVVILDQLHLLNAYTYLLELSGKTGRKSNLFLDRTAWKPSSWTTKGGNLSGTRHLPTFSFVMTRVTSHGMLVQCTKNWFGGI
jgi:hypothetical protein